MTVPSELTTHRNRAAIMQRLGTIAVFVVVSSIAARETGVAQETAADARVTWLSDHAVHVGSVSPANVQFTDLVALKDVLKDVSIVMLGEQSHGDGTTFLAKTRLIRFLHQEMGFDVLAFESGLYDCWKAWLHLRSGGQPADALALALFSLWSRSEQVLPLGEYLAASASTDRPLELTGFDIQPSGRASQGLIGDLAVVLTEIGSRIVDGDQWSLFAAIEERLLTRRYVRGDAPLPARAEREQFAATVAALRHEVEAASGRNEGPDLDLWAQILEGMDAYARMVWLVDPADLRPTPGDARIRDSQMATNLLWLAQERYRDRKIIVWAATSHVARHLADVKSPLPDVQVIYDSVPTLGELVWDVLRERVYSLGFTAYEGEAGNVFGARWPLATPSTGSLEDLMYRAGLENAIVDFRSAGRSGAWLGDELVARPMGYGEVRARWNRVLDGLMFTRRMTPSVRVSEPPGDHPSATSLRKSGTPCAFT